MTHAAAPGDPGHNPTVPDTHSYRPTQDAHWLYLKYHYLVRSGVTRGMPKGKKNQTWIGSCSQSNAARCFGATPNSGSGCLSDACSLNYGLVQGVYEPGNGDFPNNGLGTSGLDDYSNNYYVASRPDNDFYDLCGPGAADIALEYWPAPPNSESLVNVTDPAYYAYYNVNTTTSWNGVRMRGYMTYLAWQLNWPADSAGTPWHIKGQDPIGMMDNSRFTSWGVTLYGMRDGLNWAASGENTSNWFSYFYAIAWISQNNSHLILHKDIMTDIYYDNVPVVAEVDVKYLPNWSQIYAGTHHFITIIGYDDTSGVYYYTDTCGYDTPCNPSTNQQKVQINFDNTHVYTISQINLWGAITSITENQGNAPNLGDGGWVW
jgi:hypothetical protein